MCDENCKNYGVNLKISSDPFEDVIAMINQELESMGIDYKENSFKDKNGVKSFYSFSKAAKENEESVIPNDITTCKIPPYFTRELSTLGTESKPKSRKLSKILKKQEPRVTYIRNNPFKTSQTQSSRVYIKKKLNSNSISHLKSI